MSTSLTDLCVTLGYTDEQIEDAVLDFNVDAGVLDDAVEVINTLRKEVAKLNAKIEDLDEEILELQRCAYDPF